MRVDVRDAVRGSVLATFEGNALAQRFAQPGAAPDDGNSAVIAPGRRGVLYLELTLPASAPPPRALDHRIDYIVAGVETRAEVIGARTPVSDAAPPRLGAPLRGGPWAAIHHPEWPRGHRRVFYAVDGRARIPGRFAIDWVKLDANGRSTRGNKDRTANTLGHGAEVLAVADAVVAAVRDDMPESAAISAHPKHALGDATGNYVALDLGDGHYAFYEHLKPGSVRVAHGQRVRRGETIAALGFTGDSTGPHLHFHVADAASPLGAEGVPFVFERFDVLGRYGDIGKLGDAPWDSLPDELPVRRTAERPGVNVVVDFGH
jgi:murein DD-endopeptidase MepM/ murein hydrolase activator NlpD